MPGAGASEWQLLMHGVLIIVVAASIEPPLVLLGERVTRWLGEQPSVGKWLDRGLGALFVALGLRLAFSERP